MLATTETLKVDSGMLLDVSTLKAPSVSRLTPLAEPMRAYELESITQMDKFEEANASTFGNPYPFLLTNSFRSLGKETYLLQSGTTSTVKTDEA